MLRFIEVYCGIDALLEKDASTSEQYHMIIHSLILFMLAFKHNLWLSNLDEFVKSQYFDKKDIQALVLLLKPLIVNLINNAEKLEREKRKMSILDEFVLMAAS